MYDAHWHCTDTYNKKMMLPECQALLSVTLYFLTIYFLFAEKSDEIKTMKIIGSNSIIF